jgi:predicted DNA-binding protein with PD1-like motif
MTDPVLAAAPQRPRTMVHPGPVQPVRIEHREAAGSRHVRLALEPGRTLHDALVEPLARLGIRCASMTLLGGPLASLSYCVATSDPTGERVAMYARPIEAGQAQLVFGNATLGRGADDRPLVHCHATFALEGGLLRGGHVVTDRTRVGAVPISVLVTALEGFTLRQSYDEETHMPLMRPVDLVAAVAADVGGDRKEARHAR